jgi:hypothetical protein
MKEFLKFVGLFSGLALAFLGTLFLLIIGIGLMLGGSGPEEDSFMHEVEYTADIQANGTLNDTEILLPFPQDEEFQKSVELNSSNVSLHNDWNASLSVVNTSRGEMLEADIGEFDPEHSRERFQRMINNTDINETGTEIERPKVRTGEMNGTEINDYVSYSLVILVDYNRTLDTRNGLETEPHLFSNRSADDCGPSETDECVSTEAYLSYDTGNGTHVDLNVDLEGRNSWWNWGWSGNHYSQRFYTSFYDDGNLVGSQEEWITLTGRQDQGEGNYRE